MMYWVFADFCIRGFTFFMLGTERFGQASGSGGSAESNLRGMFEMNCLFLSGDFKFQVSPKVLISCPRSTPRG